MRPGSIWIRALRLILLLYPPGFRRSVGADMVAVFTGELRRRRAECGRAGAIRFALGTLVSAVVEGVAERITTGGGWMGIIDAVMQDVRYGLRSLGRAPGFTFTSMATLALGIGASTAIFGVAWSVWLRPLPYREPERLVGVNDLRRGSEFYAVSAPELAEYQARARSFEGIAAAVYGAGFATVDGEPVRIVAFSVQHDLLSLLGAAPALGRVFTEDDVGAPVVLLSHDFWLRWFHGDPGVVGRTLELFGQSLTILGVMPRDFSFPETQPSDVWRLLPLGWDPSMDRTARLLRVVGRLRSDVTLEQARTDMEQIAADMARRYPSTNEGWSVALTPVIDQLVGPYRTAFGSLLAAVGILLVIACLNIASVVLARNTSRRHETAVRAALGAGRSRLALQGLVESTLLAIMGGIVGFGLAILGTSAFAALLPRWTPRLAQVRLDGAAFLFCAVVTGISGVLAGLLPALRRSAVTPGDALRSGARSILGSARPRLQAGLVVAEVAFSIVLVVVGGLMVQRLAELAGRDRGFESDGLLTMHVIFPFDGRYDASETRVRALHEMVERLTALPDVTDAGAVTGFPDSSLGYLGQPALSVEPGDIGGAVPSALRAVDGGYFRTMAVPVLEGRTFGAEDETGPLRIIINRTLAERLWPQAGHVVGRTLAFPAVVSVPETPRAEVIGVVGDIAVDGKPTPQVFVPFTSTGAYWSDLVVRVRTGPDRIAPAVRATLRAYEAALAIEDMAPMNRVLAQRLALQRAQSVTIGTFSMLALLLAAVGLYGLLSWLVSQRVQEMGIRFALGASRGDVFGVVARRGIGLAALGLVFGLVAALGAVRALRGHVFGLDRLDPWTLVFAAGLLLAVALLACWIPARRAMRVDPGTALR